MCSFSHDEAGDLGLGRRGEVTFSSHHLKGASVRTVDVLLDHRAEAVFVWSPSPLFHPGRIGRKSLLSAHSELGGTDAPPH